MPVCDPAGFLSPSIRPARGLVARGEPETKEQGGEMPQSVRVSSVDNGVLKKEEVES